MKTLILTMTLLLLASVPAAAQTKITQEMANAYNASCMQQKDPRLTPQSQEAMCACTSVKMMETMSVEEIKIMGGNTQESRNKLNHMLVNVYGPCMQFPVTDLVQGECVKNPQLAGSKNKEAVCKCMAGRTGSWFAAVGKNLMSDLLKKNPNMTDPISPVMDSDAFKKESYRNLTSCMGL